MLDLYSEFSTMNEEVELNSSKETTLSSNGHHMVRMLRVIHGKLEEWKVLEYLSVGVVVFFIVIHL